MRALRLLRLLEATPEGRTLTDLADAFEVTTRTIRRDFAALRLAGEGVRVRLGRWGLVGAAPTVTRDQAPCVEPGLYRHHRGGFYRVEGVAHDSTNGAGHGRWLVLYRSESTGVLLARDLEEFRGEAAPGVPRFARVEVRAATAIATTERSDAT